MHGSASKSSRRWRISAAEVAASVLIPGDEWHPLDGGTPPEYIPEQWDAVHASVRLVDAFKTSANLPGTGLRSVATAWPQYYYEWEDLLAQRQSDLVTQEEDAKERNRARVRPSAQQISQMEIAFHWPWKYIQNSDIARIVGRVAIGRSRDLDMRHIAWKMRLDPKFLRDRNRLGLDTIGDGLRRDRVPVF